MSLHFRRLSIILTEYLSHRKRTSINNITLYVFENFLLSLRKPRGIISGCVREILNILCGRSDVDDAAQNRIATWIRGIHTLTSVSKNHPKCLGKNTYKIYVVRMLDKNRK